MSQYTENYHLEKPESNDDFENFLDNYGSNMDIIDEHLGQGGGGSSVSWSQLQVTGDKIATIRISGIDTDVYSPNSQTFSMAISRANINSDEKYSTIFGKIKKWFADLKAVAFSGSYNDLSDTPTKVSDFTNDSGFVTPTVNNLANYYLKSETYTQAQVDALIGGKVNDVEVNGSSVVNQQGVAEITVPDDLADLADDSTHRTVTDTEKSTWSAKVSDNPTFTEASTRANIASGESFATILGKIKKFFTDLKSVAFSGAYSDLNGTPTKLSDFTDDVGYLESSDITVTQIQSTGTKIATIDVDGTSTDLYAPAGGGGGSVNDVTVNGTSVVNAQGVAEVITSDRVAKSGDTMSGCLAVSATGASGNFDEGIRINHGKNNYFSFLLGGTVNSTSGTNDGAFWIGGSSFTQPRKLFIAHNGSTASKTYFHASSSSDQSPKLQIPSGSIASADYDAVNGDAVYSYLASGNKDRDEHNANSCTKNGGYYYTSNGPSTSLGASTTDGALYVQAYDSNWVAQSAQDYRNGRLFVRGKNKGTWQSWLRIALYSEIPDISGKVNRSGDTMTGALTIEGTDNFAEGVRCNTASDGYFSLLLGGTGTSGTRDGAFWLGGNNTQQARKLFISHNSATQSGTYFYANSASDASPSLRIGGNLNVVNSTTIYSSSTDTVLNLSTAVRSGECCIKFSGITSGGGSVTLADMYVDQYDIGKKGVGTVRRPLAYRSEISSKRYKENISPILEEDAKKILDVEIVNFDYKEEYEVVAEKDRCNNVGVIAEDVVNLIPNAVTYADIEGEQLPDSVNYTKFIPYLIKMVQMQQKEIEELKAMIKGE